MLKGAMGNKEKLQIKIVLGKILISTDEFASRYFIYVFSALLK